jgi:hypothetical protein
MMQQYLTGAGLDFPRSAVKTYTGPYTSLAPWVASRVLMGFSQQLIALARSAA